jgi:hypothetical protein
METPVRTSNDRPAASPRSEPFSRGWRADGDLDDENAKGWVL